MNWYVRFGLFFLRPILDAYYEQRVSEQAKGKLVAITRDIRDRVSSGEIHR